MTRVLSAIILIPLAILAVIYASPVYYLIGIGFIGTLCLYEYFGMTRAMGIQVQPLFGFMAFWILLIAFRQDRFPVVILVAFVMLAVFLSTMWRYRLPVQERAWALMAELLGVFYFAVFLYPAIPLRFDFGGKIGLQWTLMLLVVIWTGDTAALVVGKTFGKTTFAPILSPRKTYEGAAAGLLAGIGIAVAMKSLFFHQVPMVHAILASTLVGIFGQLGDLAESMLKRAAQIKDSSHLIPGHGGVLDRMDSLLFALPVLYFYLILIYR
jgi:phosphatidate cytidylyltransferase